MLYRRTGHQHLLFSWGQIGPVKGRSLLGCLVYNRLPCGLLLLPDSSTHREIEIDNKLEWKVCPHSQQRQANSQHLVFMEHNRSQVLSFAYIIYSSSQEQGIVVRPSLQRRSLNLERSAKMPKFTLVMPGLCPVLIQSPNSQEP